MRSLWLLGILRALSEEHSSNFYVILSRFRTACQNAILLDFDTARGADVEGRLWDAHLKLNTRFRKLLSRVSRWPIPGGRKYELISADLNSIVRRTPRRDPLRSGSLKSIIWILSNRASDSTGVTSSIYRRISEAS